MRCEQPTTRVGEVCTRRATYTAPDRHGNEERYCTRHANYYGLKRRKGWRAIIDLIPEPSDPLAFHRGRAAAAEAAMAAGGHLGLTVEHLSRPTDAADPVTVPLRFGVDGPSVGTATVREDERGLWAELHLDGLKLEDWQRDLLAGTFDGVPVPFTYSAGKSAGHGGDAICGRVLVGRGGDTADPICQLPPHHADQCRPSEPPC